MNELRDQIAALFRCAPGRGRLGDQAPGEIADSVMAVVAPLLAEREELAAQRDEWRSEFDRLCARLDEIRDAVGTGPDETAMQAIRRVSTEHNEWAAALAETAVRLSDAGYHGRLVDSVTRLIKDTSDAKDEAYAAREDLALGDGRLAERTAQRDRMRLAWISARRGRRLARMERDDLGESLPCAWCDATGIAPGDRYGRDEDGAPMHDGDDPCPKGCPVRPDIQVLIDEAREACVELAALRASAVVLPPTVQRLVDWHLSVGTADVSPMPTQSEMRAELASWRPAAVEATPARAGIALADELWPPALAGVRYGSHVGEVDAPPDPKCSCDATGAPEFPHRDYCELKHPHHPCDPRLCRFADATGETDTETRLCEKCREFPVWRADRPNHYMGHFCARCCGQCHDMSDESSTHMCVIDRWEATGADDVSR